MSYTKKLSARTAGLYERISAAFIDIFIWFTIWFAAHNLLIKDPDTPAFLLKLPGQIILLLIYLYYVLAEWNYGKTIGKYIMNIKIICSDGKNMSLKAAALRNFYKLISLVIFFVGYLMILVRRDSKALHDILSETSVVKTKDK